MTSYNQDGYQQYKRAFIRAWASKISQRAGCQPGKGGRGKKDDPLRRLTTKLAVSYDTWQKYKAGRYAPNGGQMARMHKKAIELGLLEQDGSLQAMHERAGMMSSDEWLWWQRYEANPAFEIEEQEWEMCARLHELEREAASIRYFLCGQ